MRAVVQRVTEASVVVGERELGKIGRGFLVLLGVHRDDTEADAAYMADKIVNLRIMTDDEDKMNRSLLESGGAALIVSQFTLFGDARKGRRPSFIEAAGGEQANALYESVCSAVENAGVHVEKGEFGAMMQVRLVNDGPVTLLLDSRRLF